MRSPYMYLPVLVEKLYIKFGEKFSSTLYYVSQNTIIT